MTIFSDEVLMLTAAEMEEWYERELILRAEHELRQRRIPMRGATGLHFDPATVAWTNAVIANGGTVDRSRESLINDLILGLKQDGVFTKLDRLWIFAAANTPSALTDLIKTALATAVSAPTFTVDRGFQGNGATSFINTNYNPSTNGVNWVQNSASMGAWSLTSVSTEVIGIIGQTNQVDMLIPRSAGNNDFYSINSNNSNSQFASPGPCNGLFLISRTGATALRLEQNGALINSDVTASAAPENNQIFCLRTSLGFSSVLQIAAAVLAGGLNATDSANLFTRMRTYMTAVGVP